MGQRHQIYVVLPNNHPDRQKGKGIIGIHHQWLYGHTAVRLAERLLKFVLVAKGEYNPWCSAIRRAEDMLSACYSCDPDEGYYHDVHILEHGEPQDPRKGDNNDGITVFDLRRLTGKRGSIRYCFSSFGHNGLPELTPLSAREYVRAYYPEAVSQTREAGPRVARLPDGKLNQAENRVRALERHHVPVMTPTDLHEIWPDVFAAPAPVRQPPKLVLLTDLGDAP